MKGLKGKNVLITGASSGIGRSTALRFAEEGANVVINYNKSEAKAQAAKEFSKEICDKTAEHGCIMMAVQGDISDAVEVKQMFAKVFSKLGNLDILVNNAGVQSKKESHLVTEKEYDKTLGTNLKGAFLCSQNAIKMFLHNGQGTIINNSSVHQSIPKPGYLPYSISKAGLQNLTRTLALEYADRNIRVNAVAPGAVLTAKNPWADDPYKRKMVESKIPFGRAAKPEEVAALIAFLASEESSYITGQTIFIDGGLALYPSFNEDWSTDE